MSFSRNCLVRFEPVLTIGSLPRRMTAAYASDKVTTEEVQRFHLDFRKKHGGEKGENRVSGVLFTLNDAAVVHLIEGPTRVLVELLRTIRKDGGALLKQTKILSFSEEVPREFKVWAVRALRPLDEEDFQAPKDWLRASFTLLKTFLELGRETQSSSEEKALEHLTKSETKQFMARIPSVQRVVAFAACDEMCSVDEYLEIFDKPIEFTLGALSSLLA